jgi:ATP-binding protein involved in chromosome partitioning
VLFKSNPDNKLKQMCDEQLAEYFVLEMATVVNWCQVKKGKIHITLPFAADSQHSSILEKFSEKNIAGKDVSFSTHIVAKHSKVKRLPKVKNIVAVASGKGGVGKSTTSINLAFALMQEGAKVGILDADIYGPSIPIMLGNPDQHPDSEDQRHMFPLNAFGLVANSIGYLVPPENATIWRGPMVSRALQQLVNETLWPELDYLIVDMPPGTGDIQLTLAQQVPVTAAVIVTTPQDLALADAIKGIAMFEKVEIPVLGLIENMSYYQCLNCGHQEHIFASGGGQTLASKYNAELLGQLPLDIQIRQHADGGEPLLIKQPQSPLAESYRSVARAISMGLALNTEINQDNSIPITVRP